MNVGENHIEERQKQNKRKSAIITALVHAVLVIIFLFLGLSSAFPPPIEGILVNFGTMDVGSGPKPSQVIEPPKEIAPAAPKQEAASVPETKDAPADIVTQSVEEAIPVKKAEEKKPEKKPEKKEEVKPEPVKPEKKPEKAEEVKPEKEEPKVDAKSLYTGQPSDVQDPSNEGALYKPGDQGDPKGDPSSKIYEGDTKGLGNMGVGYDLAGRNMLTIPNIDESYKETGKVVVSIKVDRNGKVIFAKYTVKGSTTSDPKLIRLAEEAAMKAKFNSNSQAAEEQFGSITFTFKLR